MKGKCLYIGKRGTPLVKMAVELEGFELYDRRQLVMVSDEYHPF